MNTTISCGSNSSIEKQFQGEYTHAKFKEVQAEFRSKMNCAYSLNTVESCFATYHVLEDVLVWDRTKDHVFKVVFNRENHDLSCECSLFEFRGILCRHVLCVCAQERVKNVPEKCVLARWNKNIKRKHTYIKSNYCVTQLKPQMDRFDKLCKHFYEVVEVAAEFEDTSKDLREILHQFTYDLPIRNATTENDKGSFNGDSNPNNGTEIHSPLRVKRKGRPPSKRKMFAINKAIKKPSKRSKQSDGRGTNVCFILFTTFVITMYIWILHLNFLFVQICRTPILKE